MSNLQQATVSRGGDRRRSLQRLPLVAALLCALAPGAGMAGTITVTNASEFSGSGCHIHDAIESANTNTAVNGCVAGSGADTIMFAADVNDIVLSYGLYVTQALTLQGSSSGVTLRRDTGAVATPIIMVDPEHTNVPLQIVRVAVHNGLVPTAPYYCEYAGGGGIVTASQITLVSSEVSGNKTMDTCASGGGIEAFGADVSLIDSVVKNNSTTGALASGGGIHTTGRVTLANSQVSGNTTAGSAASGGGVFAGSLTLSSSTISDNHTTGGDAKGGGARATSFDATDSTISGNSTIGVTAAGGGVFADAITLSRTILSDNHTSGNNANGGGAQATSFDATQSTISGNSTNGSNALGGGVLAYTFQMHAGTLSGNSTMGDTAAGGGFAGGRANGVLFENSTVSSNSTAGMHAVGGGIAVFGNSFSLLNSTVTGNVATHALGDGVYAQNDNDEVSVTPSHFDSSLIAGNGDSNLASGTLSAHPIALQITGANNLIGNLSGPVTAPTGTLTCDPQLQPLADNGGLTRTHALGMGSCAIDVGSNTGNLAVDQRGNGFVRESGVAADIGAFERQPNDLIFRNGFGG